MSTGKKSTGSIYAQRRLHFQHGGRTSAEGAVVQAGQILASRLDIAREPLADFLGATPEDHRLFGGAPAPYRVNPALGMP
jgi:hypothetical protein